ncbi:hypothetical protein MXB_5156, partial [Myxobolus squamalis]
MNSPIKSKSMTTSAHLNIFVLPHACDLPSYVKGVLFMLDLFVKIEAWDRLIDMLTQLSKRRGQFKHAIVEMVHRSITYLDQIKEKPLFIQFVKILCQICENKNQIYVENERARLLMILSKEAELENNVEAALNYIRELGVESYITMPSDEKNQIMLEQIRLCLANNDLVRAQLVSNRIHANTIDEILNPNLKFTYYHTLMKLQFLKKNYVIFTELGLSCASLSSVMSDSDLFFPILKTVVICLLCCPFDQIRQSLTSSVMKHRKFLQMGDLKRLLEMFTVDEIIDWSNLEQIYGLGILNFLTIGNCPYVTLTEDCHVIYKLLRTRVNEHNLKVIYKCYEKIRISRLAELLRLSHDDAEIAICEAVYSKVIFARINRPQQTIVFEPDLNPPQILNAYLERINNLLMNIGYVATLINKEYNEAELIRNSE